MVRIGTCNEGLGWVSIGKSVFKSLENDGGDSFTSAVSIGIIIKCFTIPCAG